EAAGKVARWLGPGIEVLVEHPERRGVHEAVPPWKLLEGVLALVPQQRIALAVDRVHVRARGVAGRLLITSRPDLPRMRMHRAVGQDERDIARALAARLEVVELEARQVVDEVGLPHILRRRDACAAIVARMLTLALEAACVTGTLRKFAWIGEHEVEVVV